MTNKERRCCCCDGDCNQGRNCPVAYFTGWPRLNSLLNAIAYGSAILFLLVMVLLISYIVWGSK